MLHETLWKFAKLEIRQRLGGLSSHVRSVTALSIVGQTWRPFFTRSLSYCAVTCGQTWRPFFTRLAPTCDVLTGWNCWGGQQPRTLQALCIIFPYSTSVCLPASGLSTSVCLSACFRSVYLCLSVCLPLSLSATGLSASVCLSACYRPVSLPATGLSVCLSVCLPPVCLSACHQFVCLFLSVFCRSVCLCLPASGLSASVRLGLPAHRWVYLCVSARLSACPSTSLCSLGWGRGALGH